jgi:predicted short-subunit dehydrogenase-like oxidoreductase (DUF2520 family)
MAVPVSRPVDVAIIGPGNWGVSLAAALHAAHLPLREIIARRRRRSPSHTGWNNAALDARILWLCVPDAAISSTAEQIVQHRPSLTGQIVVHSSGALTAAVLEPARRAGARTASIHPVMTFPTREAVPLEGVLFGVEAEHAATRRTLHSLVRRLGGRPFDLRSETKALYHAAGTLASPLLVSALTAAIEAAQHAGLDQQTAMRWVQSLAQPTTRNLFSRGPAKSFSGPFARGDAETIRLHLMALEAHPLLAAVYRALGEQALKSLPVKNAKALAAELRRKPAKK